MVLALIDIVLQRHQLHQLVQVLVDVARVGRPEGDRFLRDQLRNFASLQQRAQRIDRERREADGLEALLVVLLNELEALHVQPHVVVLVGLEDLEDRVLVESALAHEVDRLLRQEFHLKLRGRIQNLNHVGLVDVEDLAVREPADLDHRRF